MLLNSWGEPDPDPLGIARAARVGRTSRMWRFMAVFLRALGPRIAAGGGDR
jgi:hypothetical protein